MSAILERKALTFFAALALLALSAGSSAAAQSAPGEPPLRVADGDQEQSSDKAALGSAINKSASEGNLIGVLASAIRIFNVDAARTHRVDILRREYDLTGAGILVGVYEVGGKVVAQHEAFGPRVSQADKAPLPIIFGDHATHVAGTIAADPPEDEQAPEKRLATGMAPQSRISAYDVKEQHLAEVSGASAAMVASNHSYGPAAGWEFDDDESACEEAGGKPANQTKENCRVWWGASKAKESLHFGKYTATSRAFDAAVVAAPQRSMFVAAGNDRNDDPASETGWNDWHVNNGQWTKAQRHLDGYDSGFDTILAGYASAKNVITIGAIDDIADGDLSPQRIELTSFSGFGPTDDGRIKPDLVANGSRLFSTTYATLASGAPNPAAYENKWGTSMATPVATGIATLLNQLAVSERSRALFADEMKALLINTAVAPAPGPSFSSGWGAIDALAAGRVISGDQAGSSVLRIDSSDFPVEIEMQGTAAEAVKVTLVWLDPPGAANNHGLDDPKRTLVNDLDLTLVSSANTIHGPWLLEPVRPADPPTRCTRMASDLKHCPRNSRDNVEQVAIDAAEGNAGRWKIRITAPSGTKQIFALAVAGLTEPPRP